MNKVEQFKQLISQHDITYDYSDDNRVYLRGMRQKQEILNLAKDIPEATELWNAEVNRRLSGELCKTYQWQTTEAS